MKSVLILLSLAGWMFASCKKDRVCKCTVTVSGLTYTRAVSSAANVDTTIITPLSGSNENEITLKKVTKRRAKNNCVSREEEFEEASKSGFPGIADLTITNKGTREYDCKLE
jgi:hypothetical protein